MQVIELDNSDDIVSVCDRLVWAARASDRQILFVLPPDGRVLAEPVDLVRLRRCADSLRIDVGLMVSGDEEMARQVRALGIPAFGSVAAARRGRRAWRRNRRRERLGLLSEIGWRWPVPARQDSPTSSTPMHRRRLWVYLVILLAFVLAAGTLLALGLVIPAATVTLQPLSRPLQISQVITADPAQLTVDVAGGVIPARIVTHTIIWTGETAVAGVVTTSDRQRLRGQALQGLQTAAWDQLTGRLSTGVSLLDGSLRVVEIDEEEYSTDNGAMAGSLALYLRATVAATIVEMPLINGLVYQGLLASLPGGFELVPATIQIGEIQFINQDSAERITFTVNGRAVATAKLDVRPYLAAISGRPVDEANAFLAARLPLQDAPSIALWPAWWAEQVGRLPYRPARIVVQGVEGID